jgi:hypothetical protein
LTGSLRDFLATFLATAMGRSSALCLDKLISHARLNRHKPQGLIFTGDAGSRCTERRWRSGARTELGMLRRHVWEIAAGSGRERNYWDSCRPPHMIAVSVGPCACVGRLSDHRASSRRLLCKGLRKIGIARADRGTWAASPVGYQAAWGRRLRGVRHRPGQRNPVFPHGVASVARRGLFASLRLAH